MKVELKTSNVEVENYLENIGIANMKKQMLSTFCHLVFVDGFTRIYHFKEVMQLIEKMYLDEFLDLYVTKFDGLMKADEKTTEFKFYPRSEFLKNYINEYSFKGELRGLFIEDYSPFINDLFVDINMGAHRGVQTNCFGEIEGHIYDYLDMIEKDGGNLFYKQELIDYVKENYKTVAPLEFDDVMHKNRYLKMLEEADLVEVCEEYDKDIPEFELKFQNKQTLEWVVDENSKFLNLNYDEFKDYDFKTKRYISTPKKFLVRRDK